MLSGFDDDADAELLKSYAVLCNKVSTKHYLVILSLCVKKIGAPFLLYWQLTAYYTHVLVHFMHCFHFFHCNNRTLHKSKWFCGMSRERFQHTTISVKQMVKGRIPYIGSARWVFSKFYHCPHSFCLLKNVGRLRRQSLDNWWCHFACKQIVAVLYF